MTQIARQEELSESRGEIASTLVGIRQKFEGKPDELIPILQSVQEALGYLPEKAILEVASIVGVPSSTAFGVATFYTQFRLQPVGKHIIRVCRGTACHVRGSGRIQREIQARLKVAPGETTEDRLFTLETVACFGSCALAPVVVIDGSVYGRMTSSKVGRILDRLEKEVEEPSANEPVGKRMRG
jgi:NADH-quinone oxidoreductase subunit E